MKVAVAGAANALGRRLCSRLAAKGWSVLALDSVTMSPLPGVDAKTVDLSTADLVPLFAGADVLVHLAPAFAPEARSLDQGGTALAIAERLWLSAAEARVAHAVVLSSAMVYGAWPNNSVPLTEESPVRPNDDFPYAVLYAELERRAFEWRTALVSTTLTVLRPATLVTDERASKAARLLRSVGRIRVREGDPPAQFLHIDDLVEAIEVAVEARADGVLNVAPDGSIPADTLAALAYPAPRPLLPGWAARAIASWRWRSGLASAPPGLVAYTTYPWVVSNDRLRSLGWAPHNTNEEAYVLGHEPTPLDKLNARRRQQLALGISGGVLLGVVAGVVALAVRARRRRRRSC